MIEIAKQEAKHNYHQGAILQPPFQINDKVLFQHRNIATTAPSQKLASKFLGPFPIIAKLSDLVNCLKVPKTLHMYNAFHVSLLERDHQDTIFGRCQTPPSSIVTSDNNIEWEVYQVLDSRLFGRWKKLQYLVS